MLTCFFIVGDMNADISDSSSLFGNHLLQFCSDNGLILSSKVHLPANSYTYISEAWHTTSWLDHCICTADAHDSLEAMRINYEFATTDHVPFSLSINVGNLPTLLSVNKDTRVRKIDWSNLSVEDLKYCIQSDTLLSNINLPIDAAACGDINCKNPQHGIELCSLNDNIVESLLASSGLCTRPRVSKLNQAGMNMLKSFMLSLEGLLKFGLSQADINMAPSLNLRNGLMQDLNMPYGSLRGTKTQ